MNYLPSRMIKNGTLPTKPDHRDYSFPKMFGSTQIFDKELNLDVGLTNRNQDADGYYNGCTGYTQSDLCVDEDKVIYDPIFTYKKTLFMEDRAKEVGTSIRSSLKSTIIFGVMPTIKQPKDPYLYRRGSFANVRDISMLDDFDDLRSAMQIQKIPLSIGTPWFPKWSTASKNGIIPEIDFTKYTKKSFFSKTISLKANLPWHNYKICGWKEINGEPYLIGKPWIGKQWGDNGFCYFSRNTINKVMKIYGTSAFTLTPFIKSKKQIEHVEITILQYIISLLRQLLGL